MPWLLLIFIGLPAAEIALLMAVGRRIGGWWTFLIVVAVAVLGAALARRQGLAIASRVQSELAAGRVPAASLAEGALLLLAGMLLVTPGFLTDVAGLLCLVPWTRRIILRIALARLRQAQAAGRVQVRTFGLGGAAEGDGARGFGGADIKDVPSEDVKVRRVERPVLPEDRG